MNPESASHLDDQQLVHRTDNLDFSEALLWLKAGKRVARAGWNSPNQFVLILGGGKATLSDGAVNDINPSFAIKNVKNEFQPGWVPSQGDLFADDWFVVG